MSRTREPDGGNLLRSESPVKKGSWESRAFRVDKNPALRLRSRLKPGLRGPILNGMNEFVKPPAGAFKAVDP